MLTGRNLIKQHVGNVINAATEALVLCKSGDFLLETRVKITFQGVLKFFNVNLKN